MQIVREDGRVPVADAALLCGVSEITVRKWINQGYWSDALRDIAHRQAGCAGRCEHGWTRLPSVKEGRLHYVLPVDLAKAEHATAHRARRIIVPKAA